MGRKNLAVVPKGFTLLELLVVISIIGILLAIGSVSFTTAQKKGRDSRRQADMTAVQKALEQCYSLDGKYPSAVSSGSSLACPTSAAVVMNQVPADPKGGSYTYVYTTNAGATKTDYCLCATLENLDTGNAGSTGAGGSCSFAVGGDYFCVANQQ